MSRYGPLLGRTPVGKHGDEKMIADYVKAQGGQYNQLHSDHQLIIF